MRGMRAVSGALDERSGQMSVELAVICPVVIVVALIILNLMHFVRMCSKFDRIALDAVISQGISPAGEQTRIASIDSVQACISQALGDPDVTVEVRAADANGQTAGEALVIAPNLTRFVCSFEMRPWPSSLVIAGVSMSAPALLFHERSIVVDRYRPGVVI